MGVDARFGVHGARLDPAHLRLALRAVGQQDRECQPGRNPMVSRSAQMRFNSAGPSSSLLT